ncbi:ATP-binding protein, partial [Corallococcus sp. 4LFB]
MSAVEPFTSSLEHLLAELARLDLLLRLQVWRAREAVDGDELRGLTLSEEDVVGALERPLGQPHWAEVPLPPPLDALPARLEQQAAHIELRKRESLRRGVELRLETLARRCGLGRFDVDVLLLCLAPEVDLRYERAFAWLQDDVTRRRPTVDLVLGLLCPSLEARLAARERFSPEAPLRRHELLHLHGAPGQPPPPLPGRVLELDERIAGYLHGSDSPDPGLAPHLRRVAPRPARDAVSLFPELVDRLAPFADEPLPPLVYLRGGDVADPRAAAEALGQAWGRPLLFIEGRGLLAAQDEQVEWALRQAAREALLLDAVPCWEGFEALLAGERWGPRGVLLRALEETPGPVLVCGAVPWEPAPPPLSRPFVWLEVPPPGPEEQVRLWAEALEDEATRVPPGVVPASLVRRYRLGRSQLRDAVATARSLARG